MVALFRSDPPAPCPAPFNAADYVLAAGRARPDHPALTCLGHGGDDLTHGALRARVIETAGALAQMTAPGDRIILRLGNRPFFPIAFLAAIWAGRVPVPVSAALTAVEVARQIKTVDPQLILADPDLPLPQTDVPCHDATQPLLGDPIPAVQADPNDLAYMVFTSGTGGQARSVMHAHRAIWARRMMWGAWYGLTAQDRVLHAGAFNWTYTLGTGLLDPWAIGATALIPGPGTGSGALLPLIEEAGATLFAAAPGVFRQALRGAGTGGPTLRHALSAGEAMPPALAQAWQARTGTQVYQALGMSECSTYISQVPGDPPQGAGRPQPGRTLAVLDADGTPVTWDSPGELAIDDQDQGLTLGYWPDPRPPGWFRTGDVVSMAEDGTVTYLGRTDDMLNAGGFRVSPLEVEGAFATHPDVTACAAVEFEVKPDARIIALAYTGPTALPIETLTAHGAQTLAMWKQPRHFVYLDHLPTTANGKLNRRALRQQLKETP